MILLVKLILAHLIGDFLLQTTYMVEQKKLKKWRAPLLYLHVALHFGLIMLVTWDIHFWLPALIIAVTHFLIDGIKLQFQKTSNRTLWFFVDQTLHLLVLLLVWWCWSPITENILTLWKPHFWIVLTGTCFLTLPAGFSIGALLAPWSNKIDEDENESLPNGGRYIGILERLLVFLMVLIGQWGAVGFLMAAKSIFRFGDLSRAKDRKLTEYILIGTLLSFGIAISTGLLVNAFF